MNSSSSSLRKIFRASDAGLMRYWQILWRELKHSTAWPYESWIDDNVGREGGILCKYPPRYFAGGESPVYAGGCIMAAFGALPKWRHGNSLCALSASGGSQKILHP